MTTSSELHQKQYPAFYIEHLVDYVEGHGGQPVDVQDIANTLPVVAHYLLFIVVGPKDEAVQGAD